MKTETYVFLARFRELCELPDSREVDDPGAGEPTLAIIEDLTADDARTIAKDVERDYYEASVFADQPVHVWAESESESAAHASRHRRRCRQAQEVEQALRDLSSDKVQRDGAYFLASAVMRHAKEVRRLRTRLGLPIRASASYEMAEERIRRLHGNLMKASDKYPNLCHFAVDAATAFSCLDDAERRSFSGDDPDASYALSLDLDPVRLGVLSVGLQAAGGPPVGCVVGRFHHLVLDSTHWYGCFHVGKDADLELAASGVAFFRQLTDPIIEEERGPGRLAVVRHRWLEVMYETFARHRAHVDSDAPRSLAWLPHNVFLTSARALELLPRKNIPIQSPLASGDVDSLTQGQSSRARQELLEALGKTIEQLIVIIEHNRPEVAFFGTSELAQRTEQICQELGLPCAFRQERTRETFGNLGVYTKYPYGDSEHRWVLHDGRGPDEMEVIKEATLSVLKAWTSIIGFWVRDDRAVDTAAGADSVPANGTQGRRSDMTDDMSQWSSRWVLFYRDSAAKHTGDEADSGCVIPREWKPFGCVDDLIPPEAEVLLKVLEEEFQGPVVDDGSILGPLYELDARAESALAEEEGTDVTLLGRLHSVLSSEGRALYDRAQEVAAHIRALRTEGQDGESASQHDDKRQRFEVVDVETGSCVVFDTAGTNHWGPVYEDEGWALDQFPEYQVEVELYRHSSGHWTLISEKSHWEFGRVGPPEARCLTDADAADWLLRHGFDPPGDVAHLASESVFTPRAPLPREQTDSDAPEAAKPRWDRERREFWFGDRLCKTFRQPAPNQTRILDAFEECGWPPRIDDPLPPRRDSDRRQRLADAAKGLNNNGVVRFELDGTTEGVLWKPVAQEPEDDGIPF